MINPNSFSPRAITKIGTYLWRQRLGRSRETISCEIKFQIHYFTRGDRRYQVIEFDVSLLWLGINAENLLSKIVLDHNLKPECLLILCIFERKWQRIQFGDWDGQRFYRAEYHSVHPIFVAAILKDEKIPISFLAVKSREKLATSLPRTNN